MYAQTFITKKYLTAAILLVISLIFFFLPLTAQAADAAAVSKCVQTLKVDKKDSKVDACVRGFGFAEANKKVTACDSSYKKSKNLSKACKTGFNLKKDAKKNNPDVTADLSAISAGGLPDPSADQNTVENALKIVFGIIGAFAVLNVTLSGFKYITSAGNEQKVAEAKNGIVYSLLGLMIAISAEAIIAFVVKEI